MTDDEIRVVALSLPEALEAAHFDATSFRVRGKIYLTLGEGRGDMRATLKLPAHIQESLLQSDPGAVEAAAGYWGRQGWTRIDPNRLGADRLADLIALAWRQVAPKRLRS